MKSTARKNSSRRITQLLGVVHLSYLGILPAAATFVLLRQYGHPFPFLIFLGGVVAVSVYLAITASFTPVPQNLGIMIFMLLDGPAFIALAQSGTNLSFSAAIDSFMVDGLAVWLAIFWLAITTGRPTKEQKIGTIFFAVIALGTVASICWPYLLGEILTQREKPFWLSLGLIEAVLVYYHLLQADEGKRPTDFSAPFIGVFVMIWVFAMFAGTATHR